MMQIEARRSHVHYILLSALKSAIVPRLNYFEAIVSSGTKWKGNESNCLREKMSEQSAAAVDLK